MKAAIHATKNYSIDELHGLYHWEGLGAYDEYCSEDGFQTVEKAIADAEACIAQLDIDGNLPELSSEIARLIIARDLTGRNEVVAIDLDNFRQCGVDTTEAYNFFPDCIGLTPDLASRYSQGYPVACAMSAQNWDAWVEGCEFVQDPGFVWLTVNTDGENDDCISALSLGEKREAIAPPDEFRAFLNDLIGFNAARYEQGYSVVCRMTSENWAAWLEMFEVAELDAETVALLCA